ASAFAGREAALRSHGFAPIRAGWLAHAARLGEVICARLPREEITGRFETVDEVGRIVLSTPEGRRKIAAGDIFF
ncbi:MAG TPA: biotin--[acetyl-CoA-carboxylase] ligase, partial [Aliiroseovarius sp.]|nr:biotin--[acetyl-CoA-carboxylase] ligase [Aliiroseovarius sp.]